MPWKVQKHEDQYCVFKVDAAGKVGEMVKGGCHKTRAEALAQQRALYAAENKEVMDALKEAGLEDTAKAMFAMPDYYDHSVYVPYGVTSFAQLEEYQKAQEKSVDTQDLSKAFIQIVRNIMGSEEEPDKMGAVTRVTREFSDIFGKIQGGEAADKELEPDQEDDQPWGEYKELPDLDLKSVWTTATVNEFPNSSFAYVEPDCKVKSCRHLPYKDKSGKVDLAHTRNALARLGDASNLPMLKGAPRQRVIAKLQSSLRSANKEANTNIIDKVVSVLKEGLGIENSAERGLMLWKENDQLHWLTRYSNNFRDDDNPREIIADESHRSFVEMVDRKEVGLPELWLWHLPEWKVGVADWVAYDDTGFALASGRVDPGKEGIVEAVAKQSDVRVSHGMPKSTIVRDPDDQTVIVRHVTKEISLLPGWAAANPFTGFTILKEDDMGIPSQKKQQLVEQWGLSPELLESLEATNVADADKANAEGRESKEKDKDAEQEQQEETTQTTEAVAAEATAESKPQNEQPPTRQEIAEAFAAVVKPIVESVDALTAWQTEMTEEIKGLKQTDEEKIKSRTDQIPNASLAALLAKEFSAIGKDETNVDGRTSLAKSKPKEEKEPAQPILASGVRIPFLEELITPATEE